MPENTLFERLGGKDAVEIAVTKFYDRILADPDLIPFFQETDMKKQMGKQRLFMTYAFGGLPNYDGESLERAHEKSRKQGLNESHFNKVAGHLVDTLHSINVPPSMIDEVIAIVAPTKEAIIGKQ
tara:strand:- start:167187 stop:167561 length:375 start_codon:yes stop_codon:yes gene_type:complete